MQEHGTGALNVDGCRIEGKPRTTHADGNHQGTAPHPMDWGEDKGYDDPGAAGRWPANVVLSPEAAEELDEQSGETSKNPAGTFGRDRVGVKNRETASGEWGYGERDVFGYGDTGGASRFFYTAKASRGERNAGLGDFPATKRADEGYGSIQEPKLDRAAPRENWEPHVTANGHPTVKPIDLMRWLVRLVTPPGGTVLDPFTGSGTTGCAAVLEGFDFIGCEREAEYLAIAKARIGWWENHAGQDTAAVLERTGLSERMQREHEERGQMGLLDAA